MSKKNNYAKIMHLCYNNCVLPFNNKKLMVPYCRNPSLGLTTKARAYKGMGQEGSPGITFHAPESVGECENEHSHPPSELPF
jgi:hypothetical protein